jgi:hypothetical protein
MWRAYMVPSVASVLLLHLGLDQVPVPGGSSENRSGLTSLCPTLLSAKKSLGRSNRKRNLCGNIVIGLTSLLLINYWTMFFSSLVRSNRKRNLCGNMLCINIMYLTSDEIFCHISNVCTLYATNLFVVLIWALYTLLNQFAPTCQVVVWWAQFTN